MSTLRTFNLQNPDSGTVNIEMDQGGNTLMTGIATVRGAAHFTSTSGSDAVGIGTDITAYKLDVRVTGAEAGLRVYNPDTSSNASGILRLGNDDNQNSAFLMLNGANNSSTVGGAANLVLGTGTARQVHLATSGTSRFAVRSDGKISAGTALDVNNSYEFSIRGADGTGCLYAHGRNHYLSTRSTSHASLTLKKSNSDSDGIDYLQLRDSSNAAKFVVQGDGTLQVLDSIKHMGDTDTFISFPANDTITLRTNGSERLRVTSDGNMGLGTVSPTARLDVRRDDTNGKIAEFHQSTGYGIQIRSSETVATIRAEYNQALIFETGTTATERVRISSAGEATFKYKVNIGEFYGGGEILSVGKSSGTGYMAFHSGGANMGFIGYADQLISGGASNELGIRSQDDILFSSSGTTERLRITSSGAVNLSTPSSSVAAGLLNVPNGSRLSSGDTPRGTYATGNGGVVDMARYEMINKCITAFPANNNAICAINGAPLFIHDARNTWDRYYALPNYLLGTLTHDCINNSSFSITLACTMTVFMGRSSTWNAVNTSGWNLIESNTSIGPFSSNTRLYVKTLGAGTHNLDNDSAMYFFSL